MIRLGVILIPAGTFLYISSFIFPLITKNPLMYFIMIIGSVVLGSSGFLLVFIGVLRDRIKQKKEEDKDDVSQY